MAVSALRVTHHILEMACMSIPRLQLGGKDQRTYCLFSRNRQYADSMHHCKNTHTGAAALLAVLQKAHGLLGAGGEPCREGGGQEGEARGERQGGEARGAHDLWGARLDLKYPQREINILVILVVKLRNNPFQLRMS